jgi:hypothetical protein
MKSMHISLMAAAMMTAISGAAQATLIQLDNITASWYDANPAAVVPLFIG